jgi:plastocyanin
MQRSSTPYLSAAAAMALVMAWNLSWGITRLGAAPFFQLTAREWRYDPKEVVTSSGDLVFYVTNGGLIEHNFVLEDLTNTKRAEIPYMEPGETFKVTMTLPPGTYTIYCSLPGHRDAGMVATLRLR